MQAALHMARGGPRRWPRLRHAVALTAVVVGLAACQTAATGPIVYTAPPEILDRTYPPVPSGSPTGSPGASAAAGDPTGSAAPSPLDQLPSVAPSDGSPAASAPIGHPGPGAILFGTGVGTDSCSVANPASVLLSTQPFYFAAHLTDQMDGTKAIVLSIIKDGELLVEHEEPADGKAFDCYGNTSPLGTLQPGAYDFKVRQGTTLEAEGKVSVR